ncbi:MAG TPA: NIPSNAP family protein [Alphaproteobacteria bacterium]|nr:NIPSNAP family protein [Alphaproteobacteria bacterium]
MIVNVRTYTIVPRKMAAYLHLVEQLAMPVMKRHGFELLGYYVAKHGRLNQVIHLWKYEDLADLERKRTARDADPDWAHYLTQTDGMVQDQEDRIMAPASFSPGSQSPG